MLNKQRRQKKKDKEGTSSSGSSRISTINMERIVQELMNKQHRDSTARNYLSVWRKFNRFCISLDVKPPLWEDRTTLFIGFLIKSGMQSSTVKSYVSAIKKTLITDGYAWDDSLVLVRSLAKACRIINDKVRTRLPIQCSLLEMLLFEMQRYFGAKKQWYLEIMFKCMFAISYYGLMRIGEVTRSQHVLRARDVHVGMNKDKILLLLYSSKTHDTSNLPQQIKISANARDKSGHYVNRHFCPFNLMRDYLTVRQSIMMEEEQFFVFSDGTAVSPVNARNLLKVLIMRLGLNDSFYGMHSFRIGRTTDLIKYRFPIDEVKRMGRWKSNVIFKYIR